MFFIARRFVAGLSKEEALGRAREIAQRGVLSTMDFLGEHVEDPGAAQSVAREYRELLEMIAALNGGEPHPTLSIKPTHLGLDIGDETAYQSMKSVLQAARRYDNFVRLDMEGSAYTERTIGLFNRLHKEFGDHAGIVIQAYLYRSADDIADLNATKARVRLCKGAYKESAGIAFKGKADVDQNYDLLCEALMKSGNCPAIATHDEIRIRNAIAYARKHGRDIKDFEFQMLLGVRTKLAMDLAKSGFRVRLYLPYGREWLSYFYRRIRERKENFLFAARNLFWR